MTTIELNHGSYFVHVIVERTTNKQAKRFGHDTVTVEFEARDRSHTATLNLTVAQAEELYLQLGQELK